MRWLLVLSLLVSNAYGNGRAPQTVGVFLKPGDPQTIYLATTFGLLASTDEGCTFRWMCEDSIGYGGTWDPAYAIGSDGTIFAPTPDGLRVSRDGGCTFSTATADVWVDALDIGPTGEVWFATAETAGTNDIFASQDNGMTFNPRGMMSIEVWYKSVKVAPSNPALVYITGYKVAGTPTAYFYRTTNGGMDWTPLPLTNVMFGATPVLRVKTIDPTNPDILYIVSEASNGAGDRLYRSSDGGQTLVEVLATSALISDVVIRDAQNVIVATQVRTGTSSIMGGPAYHSTDGGASFSELPGAPKLACVAKRADGALFGCGANWDPDYKALARSGDGGATWTKVWRFVEIAGAVQCSPGTVQHDTCDKMQWDCPTCGSDLKRQFGAKGPACGVAGDPPVDPPPKKGCCDAGNGGEVALLWLLVGVALLRRRR